MNQHVTLTFSLKYLVNFAKSSTLSNDVQLMMSNDVPLLVSSLFLTYMSFVPTDALLHRYRINSAKGSSGTTLRPKSVTNEGLLHLRLSSCVLGSHSTSSCQYLYHQSRIVRLGIHKNELSSLARSLSLLSSTASIYHPHPRSNIKDFADAVRFWSPKLEVP